MEHFANWKCVSENVQFDASQYEFFGKNVVEHELGGFGEGIEYASSEEIETVNFLSSGKQKLNRISKPRRARDITERGSSSKESFSKSRSEEPLSHPRLAGTIKWYDNRRGYGFITPSDGGVELFMHYSALKSDGVVHLWPGTSVEYESIASFDGKMQAINVTAPGGRLLQDSRKVALGELSTITTTNLGSSQSLFSTSFGRRSNVGPCFSCGQWGHLAKDCGTVAKIGEESSTQFYPSASDTGSQFKSEGCSSSCWCYYCGSLGHNRPLI